MNTIQARQITKIVKHHFKEWKGDDIDMWCPDELYMSILNCIPTDSTKECGVKADVFNSVDFFELVSCTLNLIEEVVYER